MTPLQKCTAIATELGTTWEKRKVSWDYSAQKSVWDEVPLDTPLEREVYWFANGVKTLSREGPPEYTSDINVMREAVMSLDDSKGQCVHFCEVLEALLERSDCCWIECAVPSAEHLADAFIETLDLQPPV